MNQLTEEELNLLKSIFNSVMSGSSCEELPKVINLYKKLIHIHNSQ